MISETPQVAGQADSMRTKQNATQQPHSATGAPIPIAYPMTKPSAMSHTRSEQIKIYIETQPA